MKLRKEDDIRDNFYVYYLQLKKNTDESYIQLAASMRDVGITLIPVLYNELDHFIKNGTIPLVALTDNLEKQKQFNRFRKSYLDFALRSEKITLFHLNSFTKVTSLYAEERKGFYHQMSLPLKVAEVAEKIVTFYFDKMSKDKVWPGGRRSTLNGIKGSKA